MDQWTSGEMYGQMDGFVSWVEECIDRQMDWFIGGETDR